MTVTQAIYEDFTGIAAPAVAPANTARIYADSTLPIQLMLSLDGGAYNRVLKYPIVNADVDASAAIAGTKISPDFGAQSITTTGNLLLGATPRAGSGLIRVGNNSTILAARNAANNADIPLVTTDGANNVILGSQNHQMLIMGGTVSGINLLISGTTELQVTSTSIILGAGGAGLLRFYGNTDSTFDIWPGGAGTGFSLKVVSQDMSGDNATGGKLTLRAGDGTSSTGGSEGSGGHVLLRAGRKGGGTKPDGNVAVHADPAGWNAMERGLFVGDATTNPTGNPASGIYVYSSGAAGVARGGGGTVTTWAPN